MNRAVVPAMLLLATALAGCTGEDTGTDGDPSTDDGSTDGEALSIPAPVWEVGDSWTWEDNGGWEGTFVVSEVDGDDYIVDTPDDLQAFENAQWGHPAYGAIRASDLAWTTSAGEKSVWFDFPLELDKEWSTEWAGSTYTSKVTGVAADGRVTLQTFREDGSLYIEYHYSEQMEWYEDFQFYDAEGEPGGAFTATRNPAFTGEVVRADVTEHYADEGEGPHEGSAGFDFSGAGDDSEVYAMLFLDCEQGAAALAVGNGQAGMGELAAVCPDGSFHAYGPVDGDPQDNNWGVFVDIASPDAQWAASVWLANYERIQVTPETPAE